MNGLFGFIKRERLYILLLIFVFLVSALMALAGSEVKPKPRHSVADIMDRTRLGPEQAEALLRGRPALAILLSLSSLLVFATILLGIVIDIILVSVKVGGGKIDIRTYAPAPARWGLIDVARVVILFTFFGYIIIMIESLLAGVFPIIKSDNFRMIFNSSILDTLGVVFIVYFTIGQYKERLESLGLSVRNFFRNIFYGATAYIATAPILVAALMAVLLVVKMTKYVPEPQPVVELFLKERNQAFLIYTSVFAAMAGPLIEELFFRAFMYGALKKVTGVFWATIFTASVFAALHANLIGFLPILVLGILLTYLYEKTGTLVSSITVHMIHNLGMVFFVFLIRQLNG